MNPESTFSRTFYITTYVSLIILTALSLLVTGYDLINQVIHLAPGGGKYLYIFIIVGAYASTGLLAGLIALSRIITNRQNIREIPKRYVPIKKGDVNKVIHKLISTELTRSALIRHSSFPKSALHPGLSPPSTTFSTSGISYTSSVLSSARMVAAKAENLHPGLQRMPSETVRIYFGRLVDLGIWGRGEDETLARDAVDEYCSRYESVRYGAVDFLEPEFGIFMRLLIFLLHRMQLPKSFHLKEQKGKTENLDDGGSIIVLSSSEDEEHDTSEAPEMLQDGHDFSSTKVLGPFFAPHSPSLSAPPSLREGSIIDRFESSINGYQSEVEAEVMEEMWERRKISSVLSGYDFNDRESAGQSLKIRRNDKDMDKVIRRRKSQSTLGSMIVHDVE